MGKPQANELQILHAEICAAMADPTRIAILYELAEGPHNVSEIIHALHLNQTTVLASPALLARPRHGYHRA